MGRRLLLFALALAGVPVLCGAAQTLRPSAGADQIVRCESNDGRDAHCAANAGGSVHLLKQLSRSACDQGRTWGVERNGIWVSQGCRAEFAVSAGDGSRTQRGSRGRVVRCESDSGRSNLCVMNTRRGVELVRQLSRSACMREQSWGWNGRGVWVSGGCRADFRPRGSERNDGSDGVGQGGESVRCESSGGRRRHCPVETSLGVRLTRQLSRTVCVESRNWGYDRRGVWVDGGCRADFATPENAHQGGR